MKKLTKLISYSLMLHGILIISSTILTFIFLFYGHSMTKASNNTEPISNIGAKNYLPLVFHIPKPIINGDFESGHIGWEEKSSTGRMIISSVSNIPILPHSGNWVAWLGATNDELSSIYQPVTILKESPSLHIWLYILSNDSCSYPYDLLQIKLTDAEYLIYMYEHVLCAENIPKGWTEFVQNDLYLGSGQNLTLTVFCNVKRTHFNNENEPIWSKVKINFASKTSPF